MSFGFQFVLYLALAIYCIGTVALMRVPAPERIVEPG